MSEKGFTSSTSEQLDAIAVANGWTRHQNTIGYAVEYRRKTLYVSMVLSVRGAVTHASTNRRGGRIAPSTAKAQWVLSQLTD